MKKADLTQENIRNELCKIKAELETVIIDSLRGKMLLKQQRTLKNRLAAIRSRNSKKDYVRKLAAKLAALEKENAELRARLTLSSSVHEPTSPAYTTLPSPQTVCKEWRDAWHAVWPTESL
jgi:hypothetical protein